MSREMNIPTGGTWQPMDWLGEKKFVAFPKLIILAAAPGGTISREQNPYLPITPRDIVENHVGAYRAGAAIVHVHVRDEKGFPSADHELFKRVILEIKNKCPDVIIDCSLSRPHEDDRIEARLDPIFKMGLPFEIGTISAGTFNTAGRNFYINRIDYLKAAICYMKERNVKAAITVYNIKQIEDMKKWAIETGIEPRPYLNLSLGLFGDPARRDILQHWLQYVPKECDWIAETAGRNWLPVAVEAIMSGGHARAGMEDSVFMYPHRDDVIKSSAESVIKVRRISEELGRDIANPQEARQILGLKGK